MEEEGAEEGEESDPAHKFARILDDHAFDALFVLWPYQAKMAATWDELLYLVERGRTQALPPVHVLAHTRAASFDGGVLRIKERGDRSLYLRGVQRLPMRPWYWRDLPTLESAVAEACETVTGIPPAPAGSAEVGQVEKTRPGKPSS